MQTQTHPTALYNLLCSTPLCESHSADLKGGTWTFKISGNHRVAAGHYLVLPEAVARLALEQEAAVQASQAITFKPIGKCEASFEHTGNSALLQVTDRQGYEARFYRNHLPTEHTRSYWHPAHWLGHLSRQDSSGRDWSSIATYVQDDFGTLVEVPA